MIIIYEGVWKELESSICYGTRELASLLSTAMELKVLELRSLLVHSSPRATENKMLDLTQACKVSAVALILRGRGKHRYCNVSYTTLASIASALET